MRDQRYVLLDGFRGLAALYVVLSHVGGESFHALQWGNLRVDFFFVLSGFVLQPRVPQGGEQGSVQARRFVRSRVLRIWPMLITVLLARLAMWGIWILRNPNEPASDFGIMNFPTSFFAAILLVQVLLPAAMEWGDPLWSLSAEWLTNLSVALGGVVLGRFIWPVCLISGYVFLFMGSLSSTPVNLGFGAMGRALIGFSLGAIVRQLNDRRVRKFWLPRFAVALTMTISIFVVQIVFHRSALPVAALVLAFFVAEIVTVNQAKVPMPILRTASYLGTVSFGIYAWHNNVIKLISSGLLPIFPMDIGQQSVIEVLKISIVVVLLSVVATHVTSRYVEKPIQMRWAKKKLVAANATP